MKKCFLALIAFGFTTPTAFGGDLRCSDALQTVSYSVVVFDGGACCGGGESSISYNGKVLKKETRHGAAPGHSGSHRDSNPILRLTEGARTDLGNSVQIGDELESHFSMNLALDTTDGSRPAPQLSNPAKISLICRQRRYNGRQPRE